MSLFRSVACFMNAYIVFVLGNIDHVTNCRLIGMKDGSAV